MKPKFCCNQNCQCGRMCPHRPAKPPTRREWLFTVGALVIVLMASFALSGCKARTDETGKGWNPAVYQDRVTGCEYLASGESSDALTPRIAADGKTHMGCREVQK
jgi:hypothetical protein